MHKQLLIPLLVITPAIVGFGAAILMYWLFRLSLIENIQKNRSVISGAKVIIGWFLGNGALVSGTFWAFDFEKKTGIEAANAVVFLMYFAAFWLTLAARLRERKTIEQYFVTALHQELSNKEVSVIMLMLRDHTDIIDAAKTLNMSTEEIKVTFASALKKLNALCHKMLKLIIEEIDKQAINK
jgi:hypothetical protein